MLEYSLISCGQLGFLSYLNEKLITCLSILAASNGNNPFVVSPDVIVASVRSRIAFVISETSALVGLGLLYIDSNI